MPDSSRGPAPQAAGRRRFLAWSSTVAMGGGLAASYGTLGWMGGSFLYHSGGAAAAWQFVATAGSIRVGETVHYTAPSGAQIVIARQSADGGEGDFIALSSICPHLGCKVHWEPQRQRFFCPCHNGAFDPQGRATEGPPAKAGQQLVRFPLKVEDGLLFIQAPMAPVGGGAGALAGGPASGRGGASS